MTNENLTDELLRIFFHIDDNTTLPEDYVKSLKKEYTGVYYDRFILGKWVVANGAIYKVFSDSPRSYDIKGSDLPGSFEYLNVGLDFGGNGSQHALCATGISHDMQKLYALKTARIPAADMTPQALYKRVYDFCEDIQKRYGKISSVYADSAKKHASGGVFFKERCRRKQRIKTSDRCRPRIFLPLIWDSL